MNIKWFIGLTLLFVIMNVLVGIAEGTGLTQSTMTKIQDIIKPDFLSLAAGAGGLIVAGLLRGSRVTGVLVGFLTAKFLTVWDLFTFNYPSMFHDEWAWFRLPFLAVGVAMAVGIWMAIRGSSTS